LFCFCFITQTGQTIYYTKPQTIYTTPSSLFSGVDWK